MLKAKLIVVGAKAKTSEVNLKLPTTIGRGREATLTVKHPLISRLHCQVTELNGELVIRDLGSLNGTFISNEQLEANEDYILPPGELLTVGGVTFRAEYDAPDGSDSEQTVATEGVSSELDDLDDTDEAVGQASLEETGDDGTADFDVEFEEVGQAGNVETKHQITNDHGTLDVDNPPVLPPSAEPSSDDDDAGGETFSSFLKGME